MRQPTRLRSPKLRSRAFTWAELLVILIVLLLVSVLAAPVFLHAREAAGRSRCLSNLRSLSTAIQAYAASNSATLPLSMPSDSVKWYPNREPAVQQATQIDSTFWANAIDIETATLECPAIEGFPFNYNGYLHGVSTRQIVRPSEVIAVWEGSGKAGTARSLPLLDCSTTETPCGYFEGTPTITTSPKGTVWTHGRGANFLFLDGHAKWRRLGQTAEIPTNNNYDPFHIYDNAGNVDKLWVDEKGHAILFKPD